MNCASTPAAFLRTIMPFRSQTTGSRNSMSQGLLLTRAAMLSPGKATDDTRRSSVILLQLFSVPIRIARLRPIHQLHRLVQELFLLFPVRAAFQLAALFGGRMQVV